MSAVRLHKAIADAGIASRRAAEEMIRQGRVAVNGEVVTAMGVVVDPNSDTITVDDTPISRTGKKRTYLFYKPPGLICTREDTHGRRTVFDIIPDEVGAGLHTAGRLDMDAEGLLILTNDGELTRRLTHPSGHLPKTYLVKVKGEVPLRALKKLRRGVELDDGVTLPASVSVIKGRGTERNTWLRIVLREGRKNQIKRMGEAVGNRVLSIKRVSIGGLTLPERMKPGSFKKLTKKEIETMLRGKEMADQGPYPSAGDGQPERSRGRKRDPGADKGGTGSKPAPKGRAAGNQPSFTETRRPPSGERRSKTPGTKTRQKTPRPPQGRRRSS